MPNRKNARVNDVIRSFVAKGLGAAEIRDALAQKRMKAPMARIQYYVMKGRDTGTVQGEAVTTTPTAQKVVTPYERALQVLEADVLTDAEKVAIARHILQA